jgi:hypothetical protein
MDRMVFFSDEAHAAEDPSDMILKLHVSHFVNDLDDFGGFVEYHGGEEDPFVQNVSLDSSAASKRGRHSICGIPSTRNSRILLAG